MKLNSTKIGIYFALSFLLTFGLVINPVMAGPDLSEAANFKKYEASNQKVMQEIKPDIVFMGDSITEFWLPENDDLFTNPKLINRGISGQTTTQMLLRFYSDVVALKPKYVVILAGTNDIAGNTGQISNEKIQDNIKAMVSIAKANGIKVALCTLVPADHYWWAPEMKPAVRIKELSDWINEYAKTQHLVLIDYYSPMVGEYGQVKPELAPDGVHPNAQGYHVMREILRQSALKKYVK